MLWESSDVAGDGQFVNIQRIQNNAMPKWIEFIFAPPGTRPTRPSDFVMTCNSLFFCRSSEIVGPKIVIYRLSSFMAHVATLCWRPRFGNAGGHGQNEAHGSGHWRRHAAWAALAHKHQRSIAVVALFAWLVSTCLLLVFNLCLLLLLAAPVGVCCLLFSVVSC